MIGLTADGWPERTSCFRPPRAIEYAPRGAGTADRLRSGPSDNGDETVTDTSTPPSAESSAEVDEAAAASASGSTDSASAEAKKSESVASDGDLFRQSEIA